MGRNMAEDPAYQAWATFGQFFQATHVPDEHSHIKNLYI